jgi:hypothetical protein
MRKLFIILMILAFSGSSAFSEVYSWTDEKGVKHYSSTPPDNKADYRKSSEVPYNAEEDEAQAQVYQQWLDQKRREESEKSLEKEKQSDEKKKEQEKKGEKTQNEAQKTKPDAEKPPADTEKAQVEGEKPQTETEQPPQQNQQKRRRNF